MKTLQHLKSFLFNHSVGDLLLCSRSLSCCMTQFQQSFICQTEGLTFYFTTLWYTEELMVDSLNANKPKSLALHHRASQLFVCHALWFSMLSEAFGVFFFSCTIRPWVEFSETPTAGKIWLFVLIHTSKSVLAVQVNLGWDFSHADSVSWLSIC